VQPTAVTPGSALQSLPHAPQFSVSPVTVTSQPFVADPSQLARPSSHVATAQTPMMQIPSASGGLHRRSHPPQCASEVRSASHPSDASPLQSRRFASQEKPQLPAAHVRIAPLGSGQAMPHAPQ
jgi:hypothetical protein